MDKPSVKRYLPEKSVCEMTGIAIPTLRNHRHLRKGIPYIKVGRKVLYDVLDVDNHMENHKIIF